MTQKLTDAMFAGTLATSKLTGAMGTNDGSAITGVGGSGATKSASNPVKTTNPSGGVGTLWANTSTGDLYVCADATNNDNIWVNVGDGSHAWTNTGKLYGYQSGGMWQQGYNQKIQRFSFASTGASTDMGNLTKTRENHGGTASATHGYLLGGYHSASESKDIEKFSFVAPYTASDIADLAGSNLLYPGHSGTEHNGYTHRGTDGTSGTAAACQYSSQRYNYNSGSNAINVGDMNTRTTQPACSQSTTTAYIGGGHESNTVVPKTINKMSFASEAHSVYSGSLLNSTSPSGISGLLGRHAVGGSSSTHGYVFGGYVNGGGADGHSQDCQKYSFASEANAVLQAQLGYPCGNAAVTYTATDIFIMGTAYAPSGSNQIVKYSIASDTSSATAHGTVLDPNSSTYKSGVEGRGHNF